MPSERIWPSPSSATLDPDRLVDVSLGANTVGAFGQVLIVEEDPIFHEYVVRLADPRVWTQYTLLGGSATANGQTAVGTVSSGATQYAYGVAQTSATVPYTPGRGVTVRFTASFDAAGVASSFVAVGPYHGESGLGVGYNGTAWGMFHRYGRRFEVQKFTLTAAASGSETATVTLNGTAHAVAITSGTVEQNARELAEDDNYADSGGLVQWEAWAVGDTVYFIRQATGDATGTMSYSSTGTSAATVSEFQQGADGTQTWTPQASFDDPLDGTGPSGITLDVTKLNIYEFRYGWLGSLSPELYVFGSDGKPYLVHRVPWNGANTIPWCADPRFPVTYSAASLGSTTNVTASGASVTAIQHGKTAVQGPRFPPQVASATDLGSSALIPVLSIQTSPLDAALSALNRRRLLVTSIVVEAMGSKDLEIAVRLGDPSNLTGYEFAQPNNNSPLWVESSATAWTGTAIEELRQEVVASGTAAEIKFDPPIAVERSEVLTILAQGLSSGAGSDVFVVINGFEDH